jgi:hypothetical protein
MPGGLAPACTTNRTKWLKWYELFLGDNEPNRATTAFGRRQQLFYYAINSSYLCALFLLFKFQGQPFQGAK